MWIFTVTMQTGSRDMRVLTMNEMKSNVGRFVKKLFKSSVAEMNIKPFRRRGKGGVKFMLRIEGEHITPYDKTYLKYIRDNITAFFVAGLGPNADVTVRGRHMGGSKQDGKPPEQMLVVPFDPINVRRPPTPNVLIQPSNLREHLLTCITCATMPAGQVSENCSVGQDLLRKEQK